MAHAVPDSRRCFDSVLPDFIRPGTIAANASAPPGFSGRIAKSALITARECASKPATLSWKTALLGKFMATECGFLRCRLWQGKHLQSRRNRPQQDFPPLRLRHPARRRTKASCRSRGSRKSPHRKNRIANCGKTPIRFQSVKGVRIQNSTISDSAADPLLPGCSDVEITGNTIANPES